MDYNGGHVMKIRFCLFVFFVGEGKQYFTG